MISNRARAALAAVEHYPFGDVREWARKNWTTAVCPFMDEFISALKNRNASVDEGYFDENSPAFLFTDVKAMHGLACGMRGQSAREKSEIMSEVFFPLGLKWNELLAAVQKRVGACAEVRTFKTRLALVADSVKLMFAESGLGSHADAIWELRRAMIESFGALRERVCSTPAAGLPRRSRLRYCKSNEELAALFGVSVKTITRWKDESVQTQEARDFRMVRESEHGMELVADRYRRMRQANADRHDSGRVGFREDVDYSSRRLDR